jgi:pimeloyl-ACP methyl ester carboxylesterase
VEPETRYARSGDVHIAYQVVGDGPIDLIYIPTWISQVEHYWQEPRVARFFGRLASFSRLIMFDRRGSERAAVFAQFEAGAMAALFAATHPERTSTLMLYEAMPRVSWAPDYEWALTREEREAYVERGMETWGDGSRLRPLAPRSGANERFRR